MRTRPIGIVIPLLALAALSSCSGSADSAAPMASATEPSASASMVGGVAECTVEALQPPVDEAVTALGGDNQMPIDSLDCADGWAVVSGILGPKDAPADGPQGAPTSLVFEAEGQFWIPQDKQAVCGTYEPERPDELPADALVPAALYPSGCLAG